VLPAALLLVDLVALPLVDLVALLLAALAVV
jgi:hypothetical protein